MKKEVKTHHIPQTDKIIVITISEKSGTYTLSGRVKLISGEILTAYRPCTRTTSRKEYLDGKEREIVNALSSRVSQREKSNAGKAASGKDEKAAISPAGLQIQAAFERVKNLPPHIISSSWGSNTASAALKYFERNILPFLRQHADEAENMTTTLLLQEQIKAVFAIRADGKDENAMAKALKLHLAQSETIYRCMELESETSLPMFDFSTDHIKHSQTEQFKAFPQEIRRKIAAYLLRLKDIEPLLVKRLVAMFDAGVRTSEASAVRFQEIREHITPLGSRYGVYQITEQEDAQNKGHRTKILKTENSYRTVIFSSWGMQMLQDCNLLAEEPSGDTLPVTQSDINNAFSTMLVETGISREDLMQYWDEAQRVLPSGQDISRIGALTDYIMRRDRASRWKNVCGMRSADVDMLLGHRIATDSRYETNNRRSKFALKDNLDRLAELNENYFYDGSRYPIITLSEIDGTVNLPPSLMREMQNNTDHPITLRLSLQTLEPGDDVIVTTTPAMHIVPCDAAKSNPSCPAIGSTFEGGIL